MQLGGDVHKVSVVFVFDFSVDHRFRSKCVVESEVRFDFEGDLQGQIQGQRMGNAL